MTKTCGRYLNLSDQIFAIADDDKLFPNPGEGLLDLLIGWQNPLPDLEGCWIAIEGNNDRSAHDQHGSRLMMLPQEVFLCIVEFCGNYEDVLRSSFTCREALGRLVPLATSVRNNLAKSLRNNVASAVCPSNTYLDRSWNGKRITFIFSRQPQRDAPFVEHVRSNIVAAARNRGLTTADPSVSESLRLLEDVHLLDREAEEETQELGSPLPPGVFRQTAIERVRPRNRYMAWHTTLSLITQKIGEPPATSRHYWNAARSNAQTQYHEFLHPFFFCPPPPEVKDHYLDRELNEMESRRSAEEERDRLGKNGDLTGSRLRRQVNRFRQRPYRIVNLDTLEHMDSSIVKSHFPNVETWYMDTPTFVLWVHVCYNPDNWITEYGGRTETEEFGKGRWAGHRLRYQVVGVEREYDRLCTTDITLEMIGLAVAVQQSLDSYQLLYL
jgi:hypothetical protein